jgi:hypothetical protein
MGFAFNVKFNIARFVDKVVFALSVLMAIIPTVGIVLAALNHVSNVLTVHFVRIASITCT